MQVVRAVETPRRNNTALCSRDLIMPYFVRGGENVKEPVLSMPGIERFSVDNLIRDIEQNRSVKKVLLFGLAEQKDELGSDAYGAGSPVQRAIKAIKKNFDDLTVITDICVCGYTTHGHCRILNDGTNEFDKSATLKALSKIALLHAEAGCDLVAPSAMMEGQVGAIREALDRQGFRDTGILAYSAKYRSSLYGPFRDAQNSSLEFGGKRPYQLDSGSVDEALSRIERDIAQGADMIMVKPALFYLDVIQRVKRKFDVPLTAYSVSGEYSMIKKLAGEDKSLERDIALEALRSIKRAGADLIINYFAREASVWVA